MTNSFGKEMKKWSKKAKRNVDLITKDSAQDVFELMSLRQPSVKELGGFSVGFVPVDTGELINSLEVSVGGSIKVFAEPVKKGTKVAVKAVDFPSVLASKTPGQFVEAAYTAPHALAIEYGTDYIEGRFFVKGASQKWRQIVRANAARYK